jgi:hypothetical protein
VDSSSLACPENVRVPSSRIFKSFTPSFIWYTRGCEQS